MGVDKKRDLYGETPRYCRPSGPTMIQNGPTAPMNKWDQGRILRKRILAGCCIEGPEAQDCLDAYDRHQLLLVKGLGHHTVEVIMAAGIENEILAAIPDNDATITLREMWKEQRCAGSVAWRRKYWSANLEQFMVNSSYELAEQILKGSFVPDTLRMKKEILEANLASYHEPMHMSQEGITVMLDHCMERVTEEGITPENRDLRDQTFLAVHKYASLCTCSNDQLFNGGCLCGGK